MAALKVMSFNIQEGGDGRLQAIAELIRAQDADCVALLEADSLANVEALARDLHMALTYGEANCPSAVAWLSRPPPANSNNHRLPALSKTLLEIEVVWERAPLHLFATHLGSRWDVQQPVDEVITILQVLSAAGGDLDVLVGDMNALRPGDHVGTPPAGEAKRGDAVDGAPRLAIGRILAAGYVDCFRRAHSRSRGFTYPARAPWLRLDYIFVSPSLAEYLGACDVVNTPAARRASDHLPVWATLTPTASPPDPEDSSAQRRAARPRGRDVVADGWCAAIHSSCGGTGSPTTCRK
jgi:endonuclease/exonuclease/phosphatase family metal-dependent hydrolase